MGDVQLDSFRGRILRRQLIQRYFHRMAIQIDEHPESISRIPLKFLPDGDMHTDMAIRDSFNIFSPWPEKSAGAFLRIIVLRKESIARFDTDDQTREFSHSVVFVIDER